MSNNKIFFSDRPPREYTDMDMNDHPTDDYILELENVEDERVGRATRTRYDEDVELRSRRAAASKDVSQRMYAIDNDITTLSDEQRQHKSYIKHIYQKQQNQSSVMTKLSEFAVIARDKLSTLSSHLNKVDDSVKTHTAAIDIVIPDKLTKMKEAVSLIMKEINAMKEGTSITLEEIKTMYIGMSDLLEDTMRDVDAITEGIAELQSRLEEQAKSINDIITTVDKYQMLKGFIIKTITVIATLLGSMMTMYLSGGFKVIGKFLAALVS